MREIWDTQIYFANEKFPSYPIPFLIKFCNRFDNDRFDNEVKSNL